jgi:DNA-binding NtrC family response regulator
MAPSDDEFVAPNENDSVSLDDRLRAYEAKLIAWALDASHGNKSKAAALLHVKRSTLGDRIKHCGLGGHHAESNS